ncbi:MAG: DUF1835 domain-containing protein [Williamsia sp.]|nr:DUF1835 domain-containing protein [Williamsia sp.]
MIHLVFQHADVETLQKSFELDETLSGPVLEIRDEYAVGPLFDPYTDEGIEARRTWWREVLSAGEQEGSVEEVLVNDQETVADLVSKLEADPKETAWIWVAQNKHDVSGYYWLISQLAPFQGRILILFLHNLPFISTKGTIFYPVNLFQIPPREFLKAKKLARAISAGEFENDAEEWKRLCGEDRWVRILEGGKKLAQYSADFYDQQLLGFLNADWQKASRLLHQFMQKAPHTTGDAYLLWRIKKMIEDQRIEYQGTLGAPKDFEVRLKAVAQIEIPY